MRLIVTIPVVCLAATSHLTGQTALYEQPPVTATNFGEGFGSDAVPGQFPDQLIADNFVLTEDATVTQVSFIGESDGFLADELDLTNVESFTVWIYTSEGTPAFAGVPLAEVLSITVPKEQTAATSLGVGLMDRIVYRHTVDIPGGLLLTGNREYWLAVGATLVVPENSAWLWQLAPNGYADSILAASEWSDSSAGFILFNRTNDWGDLAFSVHGETVPTCACEVDGDATQVDIFDVLVYLDVWFAGDASADIDGASGVDVFDLLAFLDCWFPASAGTCG